MHPIQAIILGALQGLTEFLPISSSAHLIIVPWLLQWRPSGLAFDVALHLGTLFALLAYFWREWYDLLKAQFRSSGGGNMRNGSRNELLLWPIILASIPAALAGKLFEKPIESSVRENMVLIGAVTVALGLVLWAADRRQGRRPIGAIRGRDWLIVGVAQALAIVPGVSRSGITITAGLLCGLQREAAAKFSFLIGAPIIFGAAAYELSHLVRRGLPADQTLPFIAGIVSATVVGYLCIGFLLSYLQKRSVGIFVAYRVVFGAVVILLSLFRS